MRARSRVIVGWSMMVSLVAASGLAEQLSLNPSKDNTLYQSASGALSNGRGSHLFTGRTAQGSNSVRRALVAFDLSALPAGSTIDSVSLTMRMSKTPTGSRVVSLHRVLQDWGEGSSNAGGQEGDGTSSASGDATWIHTFFDTATWDSPGGDYSAAVSASLDVAGSGTYTWLSTTALVADVQMWVDDPAGNFGWVLLGDETGSRTAKRFDSREGATSPVLTVDYTPAATDPGTLSFTASAYTAGEASGTVSISVVRSGGSDGEVVVAYTSSDGSAIEGVDYLAASGSLTWLDGEDGARSFDVTILDDSEDEADETVDLMLSDATGGASLGSPAAAVLTIFDDDGDTEAGTVGLADFGFIVDEDVGLATVTVTRSGGSDGDVSVDYSTEDLSAIDGSDYSSVSGTLSWMDGESGTRSFTIPILEDSQIERSELVRVVLDEPAGGAKLGELATAVVVIGDDDGAAACAAGENNLCLLGDRFQIEAEWRDQRTGNRGLGTAVEESSKTGFFWFFNSTNIELIVKMLDGRPLTGAWWLFYGALSDVEYWILATDTVTGSRRLYRNVPGDICGLGDTGAFPETKAAAASTGVARPLRETSFQSDPRPAGTITLPISQGTCVEDDETLCVLGDRFQVAVDWRDQRTGNTGVGTVVTGTDNTGFFWFFNSENLELVVKVLNGVPLNNKLWVFYGALSDVEYTITVTDTQTGAVKQYVNDPGSICGLGDTAAFDPQ